MCGLPRRRIRRQRLIRRSAGETWPARYRAGHRNQLDSGRTRRSAKIGGCGEGTSGCDWSVNSGSDGEFPIFCSLKIGNSPSDPEFLADALRNLSHDRLVDLDLPPSLHTLLDFLDVGTEVLLPSSR